MTELDVERDRQARIDLIKTYWDALMSADLVTFRSLLAPDAVIHYPGQNYLSGDYTTTDDIVELYRQLCQFIQDGVFVGEVLDITVGDKYTTVILKYDLHLPVKACTAAPPVCSCSTTATGSRSTGCTSGTR